MRKRIAAVGLSIVLGANGAAAQLPIPNPFLPTAPPAAPPSGPPGLIPPLPLRPPATFGVPPGAAAAPGSSSLVPPPGFPAVEKPSGPVAASEVPLPQPEHKIPVSAMDVSVKRVVGGWEVWAGQKVLRNTGDNEVSARDVARVLRDLRPTEWVTIGGTRPVVEYGLTNGRPAVAGVPAEVKDNANGGGFGGPTATSTVAKVVQQVDLRSARVEAIRGVWCVRDDANILLNFGTDKGAAEQAGAVIQRYGFNRIGVVGAPTEPAMSYLFVSLDPPRAAPAGALLINAQIAGLTRTGIPVPGVGFTGEMVKIDPRKVEARKDGFEWVVASGPEVLGRFGPTEWAAREAARTVQDARFTEFCKLGGPSGLTFFLANGKAPTRAPFSAQGRRFDNTALKVQQANQKWVVTEGGRQLFEVGSEQEGETVVRVVRAYGFDQTAQLAAGGAKGGITFLVKNR